MPVVQLDGYGNLWVLSPLSQSNSAPYLPYSAPSLLLVKGDGSLLSTNEFNTSLTPRLRTDGFSGYEYFISKSFVLDDKLSMIIAGEIGPLRFLALSDGAQGTPQVQFISEQNLTIEDIDVGPSGDVYILGSYRHLLPDRSVVDPVWASNTSGYISKISRNGLPHWTTLLGDPDKTISVASNVRIGNDGCIFVAGYSGYSDQTTPQVYQFDFSGIESPQSFLACLEPSGTIKWQVSIGLASELEYITDIAVSEDGFIYITGIKSVQGSIVLRPSSEAQSFISKYSSNGDLIWTNLLGEKNTRSHVIALDGLGNVLIGGETYEELGASEASWDAFVCLFDANGNANQPFVFGSTAMGYGHDVVTGLVIDPASDTIFISGRSEGLLNWISSLDTDQKRWIDSDNWPARYNDEFVASLSLNREGQIVDDISTIKPPVVKHDLVTGSLDISRSLDVDEISLYLPSGFAAPQITGFNPLLDYIVFREPSLHYFSDRDVFFLPAPPTPPAGNSKIETKSYKTSLKFHKKLVKSYGRTGDLLAYNQSTGELAYDANGIKKGFGSGGSIALFEGAPFLNTQNFLL